MSDGNMGTVVGDNSDDSVMRQRILTEGDEVGSHSYVTTVYHLGLGSNTAGMLLWVLKHAENVPPSYEEPLETLRQNLHRSLTMIRTVSERAAIDTPAQADGDGDGA